MISRYLLKYVALTLITGFMAGGMLSLFLWSHKPIPAHKEVSFQDGMLWNGGKQSAPIKIQSKETNMLTFNEATTVTVVLRPWVNCENLTVNFRAIDGLELLEPLHLEKQNCNLDENIELNALLKLSSAQGYLVADVEMTAQGVHYAASLPVPFTDKSGEVVLMKQNTNLQKTANGELVHVMYAEIK